MRWPAGVQESRSEPETKQGNEKVSWRHEGGPVFVLKVRARRRVVVVGVDDLLRQQHGW